MQSKPILSFYPSRKIRKVIQLFALMMVLTIQSFAGVKVQGKTVKISEFKISLSQLIKKIENQVSAEFIYKSEDLRDYKNLKVEKEGTIEEVLNLVLEGTDLKLQLEGNVYVISKKAPVLKPAAKQEKNELKGTVTDTDGNTLPGVSVVIKGTTTGVATNIDGNYTIEIDEDNAVLVFSFVGMLTQEISYKGQALQGVTLVADSEQMDEVVVTGYQTLSRERATGSFTQIRGEELEQRPTMNFVDKLDGKTAGLAISTDRSGNSSVEIRGKSSMNANSSPLYVVDGFPLESNILTVNPDDIESITILKDAAAASIWGVRASNGVIVVTTKGGKLNQDTKIEFSTRLAIDEKVNFGNMDWISTSNFIDMELETLDKGWTNWVSDLSKFSPFSLVEEAYAHKTGVSPDGVQWSESTFDSYINNLKGREAYKQWEDHLFRNALRQTYNLSISGGSKNNQIYASLVYNDNREAELGNDNDRINLNIRNKFIFNDKLSFLAAINTTIRKTEANGLEYRETGYAKPYESLYNEYGQLEQYYTNYNRWKSREREVMDGAFPYTFNQLEEVRNKDVTTRDVDIRAQFGLNYKPIKGLEFETKFQYERGFSNKDDYRSMDLPSMRQKVMDYYKYDADAGEMAYQIPVGIEYLYKRNHSTAWVWRNTVSYNKNWKKHQLNLFGGTELKKSFKENFNDKKYGYNKQTTTFIPVENKTLMSKLYKWDGNRLKDYFESLDNSDDREVSFFSNASYTYDEKYSLTGSFRVDQKNLFGSDPKYRYKPLWSVGAGWQLGKEDFMDDIKWLSRLNLRMTYGITGNASNQYSPYATATNSVEAVGMRVYDFLELTSPANDKLTWEETRVFNMALDFAMLNSKIHGSIEFYNKNSHKLLGNRELDPTNGFASAVINYASMQNKGVELNLSARILNSEDLSWDVNANFSYNRNELTKIDEDMRSPFYLISYGALKKGVPFSNLYSYNYAGLSDTGDVMLHDKEGNKKYWREDVSDIDEIIYHGTSVAPYYGGVSTTLKYKGFDLSVNMAYKFGHKFRYEVDHASGLSYRVVNKVWANRWQKSGDELTTRVPRITYEGVNPNTGAYESKNDTYDASTYWINSQDFIQPAAYIKCKDIILGYNMPKKVLNGTPIKYLRMSVQVNNPFMWVENKYGVDPENASRNAWANLRGVIFGLKATF